MKLMKLALPLLVALAYAPSQVFAGTTPLLAGDLNSWTVFSDTYTTTGANTQVFGSVLSGDVATTGAGSAISGNFVSVGAANIGASIVGGSQTTVSVGGYVRAGDLSTTGDGSIINGNITSSGAANVGAHSSVGGNVVSGGVATAGDTARIAGNLTSIGASSIGANATVGGNMLSNGLASTGANSRVGGSLVSSGGISFSDTSRVAGTVSNVALAVPVSLTSTLTGDLVAQVKTDAALVKGAQTALTNMGAGTAITTPVIFNMTLNSGVYSAASLSTTAGTTLTLDGQGKDNQFWVFNITDILAFGRTTTVQLINAGKNDSVIWNVGSGYASLGDGAKVIGTILADTYISVGANASVLGLNNNCGGVYSQTSYVSTGANAIIGGSGCSGSASGFDIADIGGKSVAVYSAAMISAVPEPETYGMLLAGLGMIGFMARRKKQA